MYAKVASLSLFCCPNKGLTLRLRSPLGTFHPHPLGLRMAAVLGGFSFRQQLPHFSRMYGICIPQPQLSVNACTQPHRADPPLTQNVTCLGQGVQVSG